MKTFQIVVLAMCGVLALAGLFLFATFSGIGGGNKAVGTVVIWGPFPQDAVDAGIIKLKEFDRRFNDISYVEKSQSSIDRELAEAIASGSSPDLVIITQEQLLSQQNKLTELSFDSLSEREYVDSYVPMAELFLTSQGFYGIPYLVDPLVMYYNRATLSSAGIANAPSTWEAIVALSPTITVKDQGQNILRSTLAFGEYSNVANARAILSLLLFQAGSPISETSTQGMKSALVNVGGTTNVQATESAVNFYTQFANPAKTVYSWNRSMPFSRDRFIAGDLALYPGFASERPYLELANPNLDFDMTAMPQPSTLATKSTYGLLYAFAIPRSSQNLSGAYEVAMGLANNVPLETTAQELSMAPALRSYLSTGGSDRYASVYYPQALISRGWLSPSTSVVDGIFAGMISNITSGRMDVSDAVTTADQSLDASF